LNFVDLVYIKNKPKSKELISNSSKKEKESSDDDYVNHKLFPKKNELSNNNMNIINNQEDDLIKSNNKESSNNVQDNINNDNYLKEEMIDYNIYNKNLPKNLSNNNQTNNNDQILSLNKIHQNESIAKDFYLKNKDRASEQNALKLNLNEDSKDEKLYSQSNNDRFNPKLNSSDINYKLSLSNNKEYQIEYNSNMELLNVNNLNNFDINNNNSKKSYGLIEGKEISSIKEEKKEEDIDIIDQNEDLLVGGNTLKDQLRNIKTISPRKEEKEGIIEVIGKENDTILNALVEKEINNNKNNDNTTPNK